MQCPIDQTTLAMTERQGIEIDYCPTCRGVWLDRGELDKLIAEKSNNEVYAERGQDMRYDRSSQPRYHDTHSYKHKKHKKESIFSDLFDF